MPATPGASLNASAWPADGTIGNVAPPRPGPVDELQTRQPAGTAQRPAEYTRIRATAHPAIHAVGFPQPADAFPYAAVTITVNCRPARSPFLQRRAAHNVQPESPKAIASREKYSAVRSASMITQV